jgi:hypothetical protein
MALVKIIHPEAGIGEVPDTSLPQWYASGWRLLADDEIPPPEATPEPPPMTKVQAAKAAKAAEAASAETEEN